jgi:hypothetical protein
MQERKCGGLFPKRAVALRVGEAGEIGNRLLVLFLVKI